MPVALVVSRHFPPLSSAGASIRLVKLIRYASAWGWSFIVVTQHPDYPVVPEEKLSSFMEAEIPASTQVVRIRAPFSPGAKRSDALPRQRSSLLWGLRVVWNALRRLATWQPDIVYAVAPVFVNAFAGAVLSHLAGKPLLLDLKDDWVGSPHFQQKAAWKQAIEKQLERWIIHQSCKVLVVTQGSYALYTQRYPEWRDKFALIPNGCDIQEYRFLQGRRRPAGGEKFILLTAAGKYQKDYRDAAPFFQAFARFLEDCPQARQNSEVFFLGNNLSVEYDALLYQLGIQDLVTRTEAVYREALAERLWSSDLLFLIQPEGNATAVSGTLYEYWAAGHAPVLLIAEEGASSQLVRDHRLGESFRHGDVAGIAAFIEKVYRAHQEKRPVTIQRDGIQAFDRKTLSMQMVAALDECIGRG